MKTGIHSRIRLLHPACLILPLALLTMAGRAPAQNSSVTISPAEFQRRVYAAHLMTQLDAQPELDASLQVLLDLQRRNPQADPIALAAVLQEATARYQTNAPPYIRTNGFRDEVFAAYLESFLQVPARTNFVPATLALLNQLMIQPDDYGLGSAAELVHSGDRRMLNVEQALARRAALVERCIERGSENRAFGQAMDSLLGPKIGVLLADAATDILSRNSALSNSPTMQALLALGADTTTVTVSTDQLLGLFTNETQTLWDTIHTNLAWRAEFNQSQPDLLAYLADPVAVSNSVLREAAVKQGQSPTIASATAAILVQSKLLEQADASFRIPKEVIAVGGAVASLAKGLYSSLASGGGFMKLATSGNILSAGLQIFNLLSGDPSPEEAMVQEIGNIKLLIGDLNNNMNYRFDRVDQSLTTIFSALNQQFDAIQILGGQINNIAGNVTNILTTLLDTQTDLHRLERHVLQFLQQNAHQDFVFDVNTCLGHEKIYGEPIGYSSGSVPYDVADTKFYTHAYDPTLIEDYAPCQDRDYTTPGALLNELTESGGTTVTNRLDQNVRYLKRYLSGFRGPFQNCDNELTNPREWFVGTYAYMQLAVENPTYFRRVWPGARINQIETRGSHLAQFLKELTFSDSGFDWTFHNALSNHYAGKVDGFLNSVRATEQQFANNNQFALDAWRRWSIAAPRLTNVATEVLVTRPSLSPLPRGATAIAGAIGHSLALKMDGTAVGWGFNNYGVNTIPGTATGLVAIAAGPSHNLALKSNGAVVAWGNNGSGQTNVPSSVANVVAVAAGDGYSLALRSDGRVVGWGTNYYGQATGVPSTVAPYASTGLVTVAGQTLTNVAAIAAGNRHCLALLSNRMVVAWGFSGSGEGTAPASLTNVLAIAAGASHNLALREDGTVFGWGYNYSGEATGTMKPYPNFCSTGMVMVAGQPLSNVVAIAAGDSYSLARKTDGTVVGWGHNWDGRSTGVPSHKVPNGAPVTAVTLAGKALTDVAAIAAAGGCSLALKSNGIVVAWGDNYYRQCVLPPCVTWRGALAAGGMDDIFYGLGLNADGTLVSWGRSIYGTEIGTAAGTNFMAIAAGEVHSLALRADSTVVGWGGNTYGQTNGAAAGTNVVAIAAGGSHSLALRADGTVAGWGRNNKGQAEGSIAGNEVAAIATGEEHSLALRGDGTVIGWGGNSYGQATGTPNPVFPFASTGLVAVAGQTLSNVVAIWAGSRRSLALRADGTFVGWGDPSSGHTNIPDGLTNVASVAVGRYHDVALLADGTVIGWGENSAKTPTGLTNVMEIAAYETHALALCRDGTVVGWGEPYDGLKPIPVSATNLAAIAVGSYHNLGLRADGTVIGWGAGSDSTNTGPWPYCGQAIPPGSATNVLAVAGGGTHSLALRADGTVVAWGDIYNTSVPSGLTDALAVAAGDLHSLALKADGTVVGWGDNYYAQANAAAAGNNVVAIDAGSIHSLALKADGTVFGWGENYYGQATGVPNTGYPSTSTGVVSVAGQVLNGVVAIAAGDSHGMALRTNGTVICWGSNSKGQTNTPAGLTNVVAIAAGALHSLALRADGTVVGWGDNSCAQITIPPGATNVVAIAASSYHSLFLTASAGAETPGVGSSLYVRAQIPSRAGYLFRGANSAILGTLSSNPAIELAGVKALILAVLELGMPYTLERDDVLRGFFYGNESMADVEVSRAFLEAENEKLAARPDAQPQVFREVAQFRYERFRERLAACLSKLSDTSQPEIPRIVGHTLRLVNLLQEAYAPVAKPVLEMWREGGTPRLVLYGEPYVRYTLQYRDSLSVPGWYSAGITNLQNEQVITPPVSGPSRFYRALLPVP